MSDHVVATLPGRSSFDTARWRCFGTGEGCGVWYSVYVKPWEMPQSVAHQAAERHINGERHASD